MKKESLPHSLTHGTAQTPNRTICYVAGHSGGHIIPCLTLAKQKLQKENGCILFFTSDKQLDHTIVAQSDTPLEHISLAIKQQQRTWYRLPLIALSLGWAFAKSFWYLMTHIPDRIITTGSIVAIPVCLAGWILGIPIELFELNAHAGRTPLFLSYFAETIRHCFAATRTQFPHNHCVLTKYPIRFTNTHSHPKLFPTFESNRLTLFVQGGSQGSLGINTLMQTLLTQNSELCKKIQVIHQAGTHEKNVRNMYAVMGVPAHVFEYDHDLAQYYHASDLVICRSGAGALFETLHFKKPCITIPLIIPSNDNQLKNARAMAHEYPDLFHMAFTVPEALKAIQRYQYRKIAKH